MRLPLVLLSCLPLAAQIIQPSVVTATAGNGGPGTPKVSLSVSVQVRSRTFLTGFSCAFAPDGILEIGDSVTCTLTSNQKTRNGLMVTISYPVGIGGPDSVTIPNAAAEVSFTITAVDAPIAGLVPMAHTVWGPKLRARAYAEFHQVVGL